MKVVTFKGYVVKFCSDKRCSHQDSEYCVNSKSSEFYIPENIAEQLSKNIVAGTPVVLYHESKCQLGEVRDSRVTNSGIVVRGYINDSEMLTSLQSQVDKYKDLYCKKISYEDYLQNIFSSISLSHDPKTLHVNHVGLVNIPGRTGTEVKYETTQNIPVKRYPNAEANVRDSISAHLVAFLRNSNRVEKLVRNGRNSYANRVPKYLQASEKPYSYPKHKMKQDLYVTLAAQLIEMANRHKSPPARDEYPAILAPVIPDDRRTQAVKRSADDDADVAYKKQRIENEEAIKSMKTFQVEMASNYEKKLAELEESQSKKMTELTTILQSVVAPPPPPPTPVSIPALLPAPVACSTSTASHEPVYNSEPIAIEASTVTSRVNLEEMRRRELQSILLDTLKSSLTGVSR